MMIHWSLLLALGRNNDSMWCTNSEGNILKTLVGCSKFAEDLLHTATQLTVCGHIFVAFSDLDGLRIQPPSWWLGWFRLSDEKKLAS